MTEEKGWEREKRSGAEVGVEERKSSCGAGELGLLRQRRWSGSLVARRFVAVNHPTNSIFSDTPPFDSDIAADDR
jgi:hypothetical protein